MTWYSIWTRGASITNGPRRSSQTVNPTQSLTTEHQEFIYHRTQTNKIKHSKLHPVQLLLAQSFSHSTTDNQVYAVFCLESVLPVTCEFGEKISVNRIQVRIKINLLQNLHLIGHQKLQMPTTEPCFPSGPLSPGLPR